MQTHARDVRVGQYFGERRIDITPQLVRHYLDAVEDSHPWYTDDSPFGGPVAPAFILHSEVYHTVDWYLSIFGNLHARQEWEVFAPILVGDTVFTRRQVVDRYVKRDREYVVMEVGCYAVDGRLLNRARTHQSFLIGRSGDTVVDKEREKRPDRRFESGDVRSLRDVAGPEKEVTLEMCRLFSGPHKNYHNDVEEARKLGFPDIVVQGMMSLCFISEMMTQNFEKGWLAGGRMSVNLVNVLWQGEKVTIRGAVVDLAPEGLRQREQLQVWCEKADGTKIVVGTASALSG